MATTEQFKIMLAEVEADIFKAEEGVRELKAVAKYLRKRINGHLENNPLLPSIEEYNSTAFTKVKLPAAMLEVLGLRRGPMHTNEIAAELVKGGYKNRESLAASVSTTAHRRNDLFTKVGPATYALRNGEDDG